jgi:signal transduction histidine kinase/CheY-like chemotaxis protein
MLKLRRFKQGHPSAEESFGKNTGIRRLVTACLPLATTISVSLLAAFVIATIQHRSDERRLGQIRLARLVGLVDRINVVETDAINSGELDREDIQKIKAARAEFSQLLQLQHSHKDAALQPLIGEELSAYLEALDDEFRLMAAGQFAQAHQVDAERADPAMDRLHQSIQQTEQDFDREADRANRAGDVLTTVLLVGTAAGLGLLFQRVARAQQMALVASAEQHTLRQARAELEERVRERTAEIVRVNETLREEVAERRKAGEALQQAKGEAEEANRAKSQFLANMSHELRTPLNAIIGFSEMLCEQNCGDLNLKQAKYTHNIVTSGRHLLQLINDILDLSKIEAGRVELEYAPVNVAALLQGVQGIVQALAMQKQIALSVETAELLPAVPADEARCKQIVYNLLSNAIKFTPDGGQVKVTASVCQAPSDAERGASYVQIAVSDTGIGIKAEDQERIFGEFEQVDSSYARTQKGTGLGLALTRKLVKMHGGRLWVESEGVEGKGSMFTFTLPMGFQAREEEALAEPPVEVSETGKAADRAMRRVERLEQSATLGRRKMAGGKILIIEDNPMNMELAANLLEAAGYEVLQAGDAEKGIALAQSEAPCLILMDIALPGMDGLRATEVLKQDRRTQAIPVVAFTAHAMQGDETRALEVGCVGYITKPIDTRSFAAATARFLEAAQTSARAA